MASAAVPHHANDELVAVRLLLQGALAIHHDLLTRLDLRPRDRSLRKQAQLNAALIGRLAGGYQTALARYLFRLSKSRLIL